MTDAPRRVVEINVPRRISLTPIIILTILQYSLQEEPVTLCFMRCDLDGNRYCLQAIDVN